MRNICGVCNFDLDIEPGHAQSCSEAAWNKPEAAPEEVAPEATRELRDPYRGPMEPPSFDPETGEANGMEEK